MFSFFAVRFALRALDPLDFPALETENWLRGALGAALKRTFCVPECSDTKTCPRAAACRYIQLFEPRGAGAPSGFADSPRPFALRARELHGRHISAAAPFGFNLNVLHPGQSAVDDWTAACRRMAQDGLGPRRCPAVLESAQSRLHTIAFDPPRDPVTRVRVRFLSPTELKSQGVIAGRPEFGILAARIRDRIATLAALYGGGFDDPGFKSLGDRAALVRMTRCDVHHVEVERRSARTGQRHPLGGFTGEAEYEGDLTEFMPYLQAAVHTGVGRQTAWGKGEIAIENY